MDNKQVAIITEPVHDGSTERMEKFQALDAGQFWRARVSDSDYFDKDDVLLIQSIDWVDNKPHTVHILYHPTAQNSAGDRRFKMLCQEFLEQFDFEPDGDLVRDKELQDAQMLVTNLQKDMMDTQSDPVKFNAAIASKMGLPALPDHSGSQDSISLADGMNALATGGSLQSLKDSANHQVAKAQAAAEWITEQTTNISRAVTAMTPYLREKGAVALARTSDIQKTVKKIMKGIESLGLYTGEHVEVETLKEGKPAPDLQPLVIMQSRLYMDEELAAYIDVDAEFDFSSKQKFYDLMVEDTAFRDVILPAERSIVLVAVRRRGKNYGDPILNNVLNRENLMSFLVVRNGDNIYIVWSPIGSHEKANLLFPNRGDTDAIFKGINGKDITFNDLDYTEKLDEHESMALHYKRFLILLCGLDHRLDLFGKFYEGQKSLDFISERFQEENFKFAFDGGREALTAEKELPYVGSWIEEMNSHIQSGSRVMCYWPSLLNEDSAPGYYKIYMTRYKKSENLAIAYESDREVFVDCPVNVQNGNIQNVKVQLTLKNPNSSNKHKKSVFGSDEGGMLVVDRVDPVTLRRYIYERRHRIDHIEYMRLFKRALKQIEADRLNEVDTRDYLRKSILDSGVVSDRLESAIDQAVSNWRAAHRGDALPGLVKGKLTSEHNGLLDHLYFALGKGTSHVDQVKELLEKAGHTVLRISLTGAAKLVAYVVPEDSEKNDIGYFPWVKRIRLKAGKTGFSKAEESFVMLRETIAETTMFEAESAAQFMALRDPKISPEKLIELVNVCKQSLVTAEIFYSPDPDKMQIIEKMYFRKRSLWSKSSVAEPVISIPVGVIQNRDGDINIIVLRCLAAELICWAISRYNREKALEFRDRYAGFYRQKDTRYKEMDAIMKLETFHGLNDKNIGIGYIKPSSLKDMEAGVVMADQFTGKTFSTFNYSIAYNFDEYVGGDKGHSLIYRENMDAIDATVGVDFDPEIKLYEISQWNVSRRLEKEKKGDFTWVGIKQIRESDSHNYTSHNSPAELLGDSLKDYSITSNGRNLPVIKTTKTAIEFATGLMKKLDPRFALFGDEVYISADDPFMQDKPLAEVETIMEALEVAEPAPSKRRGFWP